MPYRIFDDDHEKSHAEAVKFLARQLAKLEPDAAEPFNDTDVYHHEKLTCERFQLAGFGPTAWACYVLNDFGDIKQAFLEYASGGVGVVLRIPDWKAEELLPVLRDASARIDRS